MKNLYLIIALLVFSMVFISCDKDEDSNDPNVINGETNLAINTVGNTFGATVKVGGSYYDVADSIFIKNNVNGVVTMHVSANLSQIPALSAINSVIPSSYKDNNGNVNVDLTFKSTSEGIQDYGFYNKKGKYHTIAKFDAKVGDTYPLTKDDGSQIVRTVTERTDQDDFPFGFYNIKTIKVEEDPMIPGIKNIVYRVNHKFGLVWFEIEMEDGSKASSYFFADYTN
ncbi:MAG: hypothetical protein V1720_14410 [bacterium]